MPTYNCVGLVHMIEQAHPDNMPEQQVVQADGEDPWNLRHVELISVYHDRQTPRNQPTI